MEVTREGATTVKQRTVAAVPVPESTGGAKISLYRLARLLTEAERIDRHTAAHTSPRLLKGGAVAAASAAVAVLTRMVIGSSDIGFLFAAAAAVFGLIGLLLLFAYALHAKCYGYIAVGFVLLFVGGCFGLVAVAN